MKSFFIAALALASLALAGCTQSIDNTIQASLPATCNLIQTAHDTFTASQVAIDIKQSTIEKEKTAYAAAQTFCADPGSVTAQNSLPRVVAAYLIVSTALKEAKVAEARAEKEKDNG